MNNFNQQNNQNYNTPIDNQSGQPQQYPQQSYIPSQQPNYPKKKKRKKWKIVLIVIGIIIAIGIVGNSNKKNSDDANSSTTNATTASTEPSSSKDKPSEPDKNINYEAVDYVKVYSNSENYKDKYVKISGKIDTIDNNVVGVTYITFKDGIEEGLTNEVYCNINENDTDVVLNKYAAGDYVEICGKVGNKTLGTLNIEDCSITADGDTAKKQLDKYAEEKLNEAQKNKDEFISECKTYTYKDIARNPNNYKGKKTHFNGQVIQVLESGNDITLRVNVSKEENEFAEGGYLYSDTVYVEYTKLDENESRILEDDIIDMYGTLEGTKTYSTVLGSDTTVPYMKAKYIKIVE